MEIKHIYFQWNIAILTSWILMETKGIPAVKQTPPKLNITTSILDVPINSTLYVRCTGQFPLSWGFKEPMSRHREELDEEIASFETSNATDSYESILKIIFLSYLDTGEYICYDDKSQVSLYVFVNDETHLLRPLHFFPFVTLHEGISGVIPCLPTISTANVTLWKVKKPSAELIELDRGLEYKPTLGFIVANPTREFKGNFNCCVQFQTTTEYLTLNIDVLPQTQSIPEVYIDDSDAKYILLHSNFTLKCQVKVQLGATSQLKWSHPVKDEHRITNQTKISKNKTILNTFQRIITNTLIVTNAQKADEGIYQCNVSDHSNRENYDEVKIAIYEHPQEPTVSFTRGVDLIFKERKQFADLNAVYTLFPFTLDISSLWSKDGHQLAPLNRKYAISSTDSEFRLKIKNLSSSDSGVYTVTAHTSGGVFNKSFHLRVKDSPTVRIQNNAACCFTPWQTYQLQCASTGFPIPSLSWFWKSIQNCTDFKCDESQWEKVTDVGEGNYISDWFGTVDDENVWSLLNVTARFSGYYKCVSKNEFGETEDVQDFIVSDSKNGFDIEVENTLPLEQDPFSMACKASYELYSDLEWWWTPLHYNGSHRVLSNEYSIKSNKPSTITLAMNIKSSFQNQSGTYTCLATSRITHNMDEKSVLIQVQEIQQPVFANASWDAELFAVLNSNVELECYVEGNPSPKIAWYKDGIQLLPNSTRNKFEHHSQKLIISRATEEDNGNYECIAENFAGKILKNITLNIIKGGISSGTSQNPSDNTTVWVVAIVVAITTIIILLAIAVRWFYGRKYKFMKLQQFNHHLFKEGDIGLFDSSLPLSDQADLLPYDNQWEFSKENLKFGRTLGQGAFGRVVKAEAFGLNEYEISTTVAVKMLKEKADVNQQKALAAELKILVHLGHHVNIVNLMGAVTTNLSKGELLVMVEYCRYGNLRNYLLRHRDKFVVDLDFYARGGVCFSESPPLDSSITVMTEVRLDSFISSSGSGSTFAVDNPSYRQRMSSISTDPDPKPPSACRTRSSSSASGSKYYFRADSHEHVITTSDLICFAFQCACGMDYLASRKLIHRDLAARNVLLADEKIVKICDFGLAKDCYKYNNYVKKGEGPLPIKWMAIESIRDHVFTTKSDVWSFGILIWEFFSLGSNPYPGVEVDDEFYKKLSLGYRMEKPDYCPQNVYHIMKDCWNEIPSKRPEFNELANTLGDFLGAEIKEQYIDLNAPYLEMNRQMEHSYLNMPRTECESTFITNPVNADSNEANTLNDEQSIIKTGSNASTQKEFADVVPVIKLGSIIEREELGSSYKRECTQASEYLQMAETINA